MRVDVTHTTAILPRGQFVQWTIRDAEPGEYRSTVERSGSLAGPWESVLVDALDRYAVLDDFTAIPSAARFTAPNALTFVDRLYYRVTVAAPGGHILRTTRETGPSAADPDPAALKIAQARRHLQFEFRKSLKFTGTPVRLYKRRQWGLRCPRCYDVRTRQVMRADCRECWGTGFKDGYWAPYDSRAVRSSLSTKVESGGDHKAEGSYATIIIPDLPQLERDDVIVSLEDQRRFVVWGQRQPELRLRGVHQILDCLELARDHVLYRLAAQPGVATPLF